MCVALQHQHAPSSIAAYDTQQHAHPLKLPSTHIPKKRQQQRLFDRDLDVGERLHDKRDLLLREPLHGLRHLRPLSQRRQLLWMLVDRRLKNESTRDCLRLSLVPFLLLYALPYRTLLPSCSKMPKLSVCEPCTESTRGRRFRLQLD